MTRAILIIDHGSRRDEANAQVEQVAAEVAARAPDCIVRFAHMELAAPDIASAVADCVAAGATELVAHPFFLGPGNHSREDIPQSVAAACAGHPGLRHVVAEPLGPDPRLADIVLDRAGAAVRSGPRRVDVYFDYISPFSYFLAERAERLAAAGVELHWRPIQLESLANFAGPGPYSPEKRRYLVHEVTRWAEHYGLPIAVPVPFPVRSELACRGALVAQEQGMFPAYHRAVFRAAWVDQRDIGEPAVLAECVRTAGGDAEKLIAAAQEPARGEALAAMAGEAEAAGVFGVPTMIADGELFWGADSVDLLLWRLRGL